MRMATLGPFCLGESKRVENIIIQNIKQFLQRHGETDEGSWVLKSVHHPKQMDSKSCGLFVCKRWMKTCARYVLDRCHVRGHTLE